MNPYESEGSLQSKNNGLQQIGSPSEQTLPTPEQISRNSSLHSSFRSSPVAGGSAYNNSPLTTASQIPLGENSSVPGSSPARPIPSRLLEPATPQNTPANVSFSSFVPYLNRNLPSRNPDKEAFKSPDRLNSPSGFPKDGVSATNLVEPVNKPSLTLGETEATFAPISAAQVTEKLEHLLAEREGERLPREVSSEASSEIDEVACNVAAELARSFEPQRETSQAANKFVEKPYEAKSNITQEKTARPASILSDVFLGQKSPTLSATRPEEVHTADNNPVTTDIQAAKSNAHPSEQYSQEQQSASTPCSVFQPTSKPADQKSSLNYVPFVRPLHQNIFYAPPKPAEQSASVYFDSTATSSTDLLPNQSSQENNWDPPVTQSVVDATNNLQPEPPTFNPTATDYSTTRPPFWSADQFSQSQAPNGTQSTSVAPNHPPPPTFYNPAEFSVNPLLPQPVFSYDQPPVQQQPSSSASPYESISGFQQTISENSAAYPLSVVPMTTAPEPTGSATLSPVQMSTNSLSNRSAQETIPPSFQNLVRHRVSRANNTRLESKQNLLSAFCPASADIWKHSNCND